MLAGAPGFGYPAIMQQAQRVGNIKILPWVPQADVAPLMAGATAFLFPTLYEGFGIPILEAMAVGTPLITSKRGANAEVAGGAALLVDPENINDLTNALERVALDESLQQQLRSAGERRVRNYTWRETAQRTWEVLR